MQEAVGDIVYPTKKEGYESLEFISNERTFEKITETEFDRIQNSLDAQKETEKIDEIRRETTTSKRTIKIKKAVYEGAGKWEFIFRTSFSASMDDCEWLAKFQAGEIHAPPGSWLSVDLEETFVLDEDGSEVSSPQRRVIKVFDVEPPELTTDMFDG